MADWFSDTSQFDLARKRAQEQNAADLQAQKDALQRRFAALGNLESGARIKMEQQVENQAQQNLGRANEGIDAQQQAELGRRGEIRQGQEFASGEAQKGRDFSRAERLGSQDFTGQQAAMQRAFLTGEREAGQAYGTGEREAAQRYATGERLSGQGFAADEAAKARAAQAAQFEQQFGLSSDQYRSSLDQFDRTFEEEKRINDANLVLANKILNKKDFLEKLGSNFSLGNIGLSTAAPINAPGAFFTKLGSSLF